MELAIERFSFSCVLVWRSQCSLFFGRGLTHQPAHTSPVCRISHKVSIIVVVVVAVVVACRGGCRFDDPRLQPRHLDTGLEGCWRGGGLYASQFLTYSHK